MIFGMTMHISTFDPTGDQKFKIGKSKMADSGHLENKKLCYLQNRLANFNKILHDDTY